MNQIPPKYPGWLDSSTLEIASLTDLPSQPVNIGPRGTFLGNQLQRVNTVLTPPAVNTAAPVNISRRVLGNGNRQYRVQFIAPSNESYQTTSVSIQSPSGTMQFFASAPEGPIVFTIPPTAGAQQLQVQNQSTNGAISDTGLGTGLTRAINQG